MIFFIVKFLNLCYFFLDYNVFVWNEKFVMFLREKENILFRDKVIKLSVNKGIM